MFLKRLLISLCVLCALLEICNKNDGMNDGGKKQKHALHAKQTQKKHIKKQFGKKGVWGKSQLCVMSNWRQNDVKTHLKKKQKKSGKKLSTR